MSKSLGNLVFVSDLLKVADPRAIRLALMRHHYRARLRVVRHRPRRGHRAAAPAARRRASAPSGADPRPFAERVRAAIDDDLDAPRRSTRSTTSPSAVLSGGDDTSAPDVLRELGALLGIDLDAPVAAVDCRLTEDERRAGRDAPVRSPRCHERAITITLPDGSSRESPAARRRPTSPRRSARGWPRPRSRPRSTATRSTSAARSTDDADGRDRHRRLATTAATCCATRPRT